MRALVIAGVTILGGCDQLFGVPVIGVGEAGGPASCAVGSPFGAGTPVPIAGQYSVEAARFDPTQTTAYLSLCAPSDSTKDSCDLFTSQYVAATGAFGVFTRLRGVSDMCSPVRCYDAYPTLTPDGAYLVFSSTRDAPYPQLFAAAACNGSFDAPALQELHLVLGAVFANEPYVLSDGKTLYFSAGNTHSDLYRANGDPPTFGATAVLVPGVNTPREEYAPVVSGDELEIFFASNRLRPTEPGMPLDIFTATRASASDGFSTPTLVTDLSTKPTNWPLWLSPDGCDLYYINKSDPLATLSVAHR